MIYTVFWKDNSRLPQDFATFQEAVKYGEEQGSKNFVIESTSGKVV